MIEIGVVDHQVLIGLPLAALAPAAEVLRRGLVKTSNGDEYEAGDALCRALIGAFTQRGSDRGILGENRGTVVDDDAATAHDAEHAFLTPLRAGKILSVSAHRIRQMCARGELVADQPDDLHWRVDRASVERERARRTGAR
jgi:hypothetical protein